MQTILSWPPTHGRTALPWRESRRLYQVAVDGGGWLVDVHHPATIAALEAARDGAVSRFLANQGIPALNVCVLTGENRLVTTMLAEIIRDTELDDGTTPRGVHFGSKHGGAWRRAIWLPYQDALPTGLRVRGITEIRADDPALLTVAGWFRFLTTSAHRITAVRSRPMLAPQMKAARARWWLPAREIYRVLEAVASR